MPIKHTNTTIGFPQDSFWNYVSDNLELATRITTEMVDGCNTGLLTVCEKSTKTEPKFPGIRSILANHKKNAFTVAWDDRTATTIHLQEGDTWDDEKALAMCYVKKLMGNKGSFNDIFTQELPKKLKVIKTEKELEIEELNKQMDRVKKAIDSFTSACEAASNETLRSPINGQIELDINPEETDNTEKAVETTNAFIEKICELCNKPQAEKRTYEIYDYDTFTKKKSLIYTNISSLERTRELVKHHAKSNHLGLYYRTWNTTDGGMFIDYGSYRSYLYIPNLTNSEYCGK